MMHKPLAHRIQRNILFHTRTNAIDSTSLRPCRRVQWVLHLALSPRTWSEMWTHHMKPLSKPLWMQGRALSGYWRPWRRHQGVFRGTRYPDPWEPKQWKWQEPAGRSRASANGGHRSCSSKRSPVNSPHKDQWRGALKFSLICARINGWVNNGEAGDLRRNRAHYDVIVMNSTSGAAVYIRQTSFFVSFLFIGASLYMISENNLWKLHKHITKDIAYWKGNVFYVV